MTLALRDCTFAYRRRRPTLRNFSYELPQGLTILLGPNGAGKSTLLRLAASVTSPTSGSVTLGSLSSRDKEFRHHVAWMPQNITPMPSLTCREYVAYVGWLKGMTRSDAWREARRALARVELTEKSDVRSSQLSGGQLRRVGVASALVHRARVLLLDEPTAGMDPRQRRIFRDILTSLTDEVQVLLSTHDVGDLAEEADHVTVLSDGKILHSGTTPSFLGLAPRGTAPGRTAEGAYMTLLHHDG
ncbi:ATP-binding cassette domain-containing protein [Streptomyces albidoflavus]|uniref:ATP-binding cassette domain-containing protein n=1 Tax=Streptomyces TaxID=1883 RepID=UPI003649F1C3|nr:ATP-binding cassette domain-containing protein [Streptomyces albidoflavus]